jgi:hypothetical protein
LPLRQPAGLASAGAAVKFQAATIAEQRSYPFKFLVAGEMDDDPAAAAACLVDVGFCPQRKSQLLF